MSLTRSHRPGPEHPRQPQAREPRPTSGATKRPRQLARLTGPSSRAAGEGGAECWGSWVPLKHRHLFKGRKKDL